MRSTLVTLGCLSYLAGVGEYAGRVNCWLVCLGRVPHIFIHNVGPTLAKMLDMNLVVVALTLWLWFKSQPKSGIITDKKAR